MPTGQPISLKCPKCMRGKYSQNRPEKGVQEDGHTSSGAWFPTRQREEWRSTRRGFVVRTLTRVECLDCKHEWWTTLLPPRKFERPEPPGPMPSRRRR